LHRSWLPNYSEVVLYRKYFGNACTKNRLMISDYDVYQRRLLAWSVGENRETYSLALCPRRVAANADAAFTKLYNRITLA